MKILAWDIETTPLLVHSWTLWPNSIPIQQMLESTEVMCFAAKWVGEKRIAFHSTHHDGKQGMLDAAWSLLDEADALLSWNGKGFDTKHMMREFLLAGMTPPSPAKEIDLMLAVKKRFRFPSNKLQHVSTALGLDGKVQHEGFGLWLRCMDGDEKAWQRMKRYNRQDVALLEEAFDRLRPWIPNLPNAALYDGDGGQDRCPDDTCGSTDLERRGYAYTGVSKFQQYRCRQCGRWCRGGKAVARVDIREVAS